VYGAVGWLVFEVDRVIWPPNDDLSDAVLVTTLPFTATMATKFATDEPDERRASCAVVGQPERAVWFRYVAPADTVLVAEVEGAVSVLSMWADGPSHPLDELRCSSPSVSPTGTSSIEEPVEEGKAYLIKMGPFADAGSTLTLRLSARAGRPVNDDVGDALAVTDLPFAHVANTERATDEADERLSSCMIDLPGMASRGVWYRLARPESGFVRLTTWGSSFDTVLSVWQGPPSHPLQEIDCNDDDNGGKWSQLYVEVDAGSTYYVKAGGQAGNVGDLVIRAETAEFPVKAGVFLPLLARYAPIQ
jgi:hypothetical protein